MKLREDELVSLNETFSEFNLQELEDRLETDPLAAGGLLDIGSSDDIALYGHCTGYRVEVCFVKVTIGKC